MYYIVCSIVNTFYLRWICYVTINQLNIVDIKVTRNKVLYNHRCQLQQRQQQQLHLMKLLIKNNNKISTLFFTLRQCKVALRSVNGMHVGGQHIIMRSQLPIHKDAGDWYCIVVAVSDCNQ